MTNLVTNNDIVATINDSQHFPSSSLHSRNEKKHFNSIPAGWYSLFTTKYGTPDLPLITVLAEICFWYTPKKVRKDGKFVYIKRFDADFWQAKYDFFKLKLGLNHQAVRRAIVKLEKLGLVKRHLRVVKTSSGRKLGNVLFLQLNEDFHSRYFLSFKNIKPAKSQTQEKNTDDNNPSSNSDSSCSSAQTMDNCNEGSIQTPRDITNNRIIKNNSKYRSIKSTFSNNENDRDDVSEKKEITPRRKKQDLAAFYPLKQEDNEQLQQMSGRGFSLNAMNEILQSIASKLKGRAFWTKHCFMKYFSKILEHEMRDAEKCSNVDFRIKANLSEEELEERQQEKYLTEIESSTDSSKIVRWKQKLIGRLSASRAYELLQSLKSAKLNGQSFEVEFSRAVQLSSYEEEQILKSAREVYEEYDYQTGQGVAVTEIRLVQAEATKKSPSLDFALGYSNHHQGQKLSLPQNILGKIRQRLIKHFGSEGLALDKSWFSKLRLEDDGKNDGQIKISSNSSFITDWINRHYYEIIERIVKGENYRKIVIS